ncbi:MAG: hypothetical protein DRO88_09050 [Promethearchaeia archaeon]|nr:MAG: hypothetical protein DRO88_09050 [Candidatus Lokiarchaeia archaeon]
MKELTWKILLLSTCNILWGLIPYPAHQLFETYSTFIIIFTRFLAMAITLLLISTVILIIGYFKKNNPSKIEFFQIVKYFTSKNREFFNIPQWSYLLIISILGLNLMTLLFFYCLKTIGAITTAIGVILSLIFIAAIKWGMGKEEMSAFKFIYLVTLIAAAVIMGINSQPIGSVSQLTWQSLLLIIAYGLALTFFVISSGMDRISANEIDIINANPNYKLIRVLLKLAILSLFCVISYIPLMIVAKFLITNQLIQNEISQFFLELPNIGDITFSLNGMFLILGLTISPYLLYYSLSTSWPKEASFDLWVGVLQLLEPIINIILGVTLLDEHFPYSWLYIIIFLLVISIMTKFVSETQAQIHAYIFLKIEPRSHIKVMKKLYLIKSAREVRSLVGEFDVMAEFQFLSSKSMNSVIQERIAKLPGLKHYKILLVLNQSVDRSLPTINKK